MGSGLEVISKWMPELFMSQLFVLGGWEVVDVCMPSLVMFVG